MEPTELDILLEELETRVERLRSLYEQYFMGIEKVPPHVVQKDVDRRLYTLRREQIRNTARRFKLQTIIQRYNTFQQYWMRIMREIENGTYRRHVLRAERTVGVTNLLTAAERKRLGLPDPQLSPESPADPAPTQTDPNPQDALDPATGVASHGAVDAPSESPADHSQQVREQIERDLGLMLDDDLDDLNTKGLLGLGVELDDPLLSSMPPPRVRKPSAKPVARRSTRPLAGPAGGVPQQPLSERRNPTPARASEPTSSHAGASASDSLAPRTTRRSLRPSRPGPTMGSPAIPNPGGLRLPASSAVAGRGLPPLPRPAAPRGAPQKIPSRPVIAIGGNDSSDAAVPRAETTNRRAVQADKPSATGEPRAPLNPALRPPPRPSGPAAPTQKFNQRAPEFGQPPARQTVSRPIDPIQRPSEQSPSSSSTTRQPSLRGMPDVRESVVPRRTNPPSRPASPEPLKLPIDAEKSAVPPRPDRHRIESPASATAPAAGAKPTRQVDALERTHVERLAEKLRAARNTTHENSLVSVDALAKKLQSTFDELSKKHVGKRIEFDVVIKDGKAIVKPIVR